ncbi:hypothetical protein A9G36_07650 [Gilliamella sp. Choc6-1]|jgi:Tfp pilus assembly protein PilN|uniref:PilN domain-containing protein n=1 Tax=unclassified Gilliamella TaxID=2685620 RepID=UPI0004DCBD06|nr:PilN domain-containing protein [Gilliamella apicola]KFA59441.1 hypothetical protein GAPWKB11_0184 [Gilliamella apicola]OCG54700.1 hypothetical protein A9G36_07650 [Gilliamella apicola]
MKIKKCRVIIYIEPKFLRYKILHTKKKEALTDHNSMIEYHYQYFSEIELLIKKLKKSVSQYAIFELHLDNTYIQMQQLPLPKIKIQLNEIALYVEASIYKLFQLSSKNVYFDFSYSSNQKQINVAICERHFIDNWIKLFEKYNLLLSFIGYLTSDNKLNFLPWRQEKQKKQKLQLIFTIASFIVVLCSLFFYIWIQEQNKLNYYVFKIAEQQTIEKQLRKKLSNYLPISSSSQKQIYQSLLILSEQLPIGSWLESFNFVKNKISIKGYSFSYLEITNFKKRVSKQESIKKSQIQAILANKNNFLFEMDIELNEQ